MPQIDDLLTALTAEVADDTTVDAGIVTYINGVPALIAAAVAAANAAGPPLTPAQVQIFTDAGAAMKANAASLTAAVAANVTPTPAP